MDHLIRFAQTHEDFREAEIEALSRHARLNIETIRYAADSPFCVIRFPVDIQSLDAVASDFESRSILSRNIYELWGQGTSYEELHQNVKTKSLHLWSLYEEASFKFSIDTFCDTRTTAEQRDIINSFSYLGFKGKISLRKPDVEFTVFEEWIASGSDPVETVNGETNGLGQLNLSRKLRKVFFGRKIGDSRRPLIEKHDLKKRPYISTTSMDAELALVTANLALAAPGKLFLDPFVGTGGFMIAAAELGAVTFGSDIDGRSFRGKGTGIGKGVGANFKKYGLQDHFGDCMTSDLTNTPFRHLQVDGSPTSRVRWLDGIICDPPYGVREGLKVLGKRDIKPLSTEVDPDSNPSQTSTPPGPHLIDGIPAHTLPGYIAPKKPYSFSRMLDDILDFAARTLVDHGRLAFWMPSANENEFGEEEVTFIPRHPLLELKHECIQRFNKWSRRLLVYERRAGNHGDLHSEVNALRIEAEAQAAGYRADDLNPFRRRYFESFGGEPRPDTANQQ